jgi:hypothetical protein
MKVMKRHKAQAGKGTSSANPKKGTRERTVFSEVKGRTVEKIELSVSADYHCISIRFLDKTDFTVEIDPCLRFTALHSDWKTGNQRVLKRWATVGGE